MQVYLQPSPVRYLLDATIANSRKELAKTPSFAFEVGFRAQCVGIAIVGVAQAVHCFALLVLLAPISFITCGRWRQLELLTDRMASLSGAGYVGMLIAMISLVDPTQAEKKTKEIAQRIDKEFKELCHTFVHQFDVEAEELAANRQASLKWNQERECSSLFYRAVSDMRRERTRLKNECVSAYPKDPLKKYEALTAIRAQMFKEVADQKRELPRLPFTQKEENRYYEDKTAAIADEALKDLYAYILAVWAKRKKKWGAEWDGESFAEQAMKLVKKIRVEDEVENLVKYVEIADNKSRAHSRFVRDIKNLTNRIKNQIDKLERPSLARRIWWRIHPTHGST